MNKNSKIFVAGHKGLVGSSIVRKLKSEGFHNIITKTKQELNLLRQTEVEDFFETESPEYVFDAAARVGGIYANDNYSADFIYENVQIQTNLIHNSWKNGVKKFLFLGSVCMYPKYAEIPVKEDSILTGELEPTNDAYAVAKINGVKMLQSYYKQYGFSSVSVIPCNLYGPGDNFHPQNGHVIPTMITRFNNSDGKKVSFWGDGSPRREFMYCDDMANACLFSMEKFKNGELVNVGTGENTTIKELAETIAAIVGFSGEINWDISRPNGTPNRVLDISKITNLGWKAEYSLLTGLRKTYGWFLSNTYYDSCK